MAPDPGQEPYEKELRRWAIQSVKDEVINSRWSLNHTIPSETKAKALVAIEQELSRLPADQLPRSELVVIAEGIRDRIYQPVIQAQQRAREEEERKRDQARQRTNLIASGVSYASRTLQQDLDGWMRLDLEQKVKRGLEQEVDGSESEADVQAQVDDLLVQQLEPAETERREKTRERLIERGAAYAKRELASEKDLDAWERLSIEGEVKQDLEQGITGEESESDVEAFVDEVLDDVLGETEEEDEEDEEDAEDDENQWDGEADWEEENEEDEAD